MAQEWSTKLLRFQLSKKQEFKGVLEMLNRKKTVYDCALVKFPKIKDERGNLTFVEQQNHIPFNIVRAYWIYDVPGGESRGAHAYFDIQECIISLSGSFDVFLDDGNAQKIVTLNRAYNGLYIPNMIWRKFQQFSTNSVAFILASQKYSESNYIREYEQFKKIKLKT